MLRLHFLDNKSSSTNSRVKVSDAKEKDLSWIFTKEHNRFGGKFYCALMTLFKNVSSILHVNLKTSALEF